VNTHPKVKKYSKSFIGFGPAVKKREEKVLLILLQPWAYAIKLS